jgi:hypothetical protein
MTKAESPDGLVLKIEPFEFALLLNMIRARKREVEKLLEKTISGYERGAANRNLKTLKQMEEALME